jgi:hypothetical protein
MFGSLRSACVTRAMSGRLGLPFTSTSPAVLNPAATGIPAFFALAIASETTTGGIAESAMPSALSAMAPLIAWFQTAGSLRPSTTFTV